MMRLDAKNSENSNIRHKEASKMDIILEEWKLQPKCHFNSMCHQSLPLHISYSPTDFHGN